MNSKYSICSKNLNLCKKFFRHCSKRKWDQDPEEAKNMPVFEYATKTTKRNRRVYMWGNAMYGALGNAGFIVPAPGRYLLRTMHRPWRFPFALEHKIHDIACGYGFTVIAATNDETSYSVFGTGLNSDYQIGYHEARKGRPLEIVAQPVPIVLPVLNLNTKAVHVACGRAHTIIVTDNEGIFSLGNNAYGQCGVAYPEAEGRLKARINKIEDFSEKITKVVCGQDHTMFLTNSGEVYSCGWGADGQTGLGHYKNQKIPEKVKGDIEGEKIVQLSCAADCVLALSEKGEVFGWGNSEYGQLKSVTDMQQINVPKRIKLKGVGKVKGVASGGTMCAVISEQGSVYVWGYGILGQGPNVTSHLEPSLLPEPLFGYNEFSPDVRVEQITCGLGHFAAVTNLGHLYMWGKNRHRCLGLGREEDQFFPYKVCVPAEVDKVICGVDHTVALCRSFV